MPKEEWGVKRLCPTTGKRFYDLNKSPIISPYTGEVVEIVSGRSRSIMPDAEDAVTKKLRGALIDEEADILDEDDVDVDLDDDILDTDEDEDVSLDDIADVAADDADL